MQTEEMQVEKVEPTPITRLIFASIQRKDAVETIWLLANLTTAVANGLLKPEDLPKDPNDVLRLVMKHGVMRK